MPDDTSATPTPTPTTAVRHHSVVLPNGIRIQVAEQGSGPLVLLVHGFPESWYSWRHQLPALAAAGFRAAAIDVRGYGRSSKPAPVDAYRVVELARDAAEVVSALGETTATIVGHDWGSTIAARAALLHPEVFTRVALMSVPFSPPGGPRPTEAFASIDGPGQFYVSYFQESGVAEAEIEPDVRGWLRGFYVALSGDAPPTPDGAPVHFVTPGGQLRDRFAPDSPLPAWLNDADLDVYAAEFERTGLTGGLNRYRNVDRDWEDLAAHEGAPLAQPSLFIGGEHDPSTSWMADAIAAYPQTLPGLVGSHILEGAGHWIQQERPELVNELLADFLLS